MQSQDLIGQQLGNYRLTALLGKGGFARVYLGEHIFLGSQAQAAIKVLNETKLSDEDRQSFLTEARTIRKLNHPYIVKILEFGMEQSRYVDGSIPYLVMDYAPNGTLRNRHPRNTVVPIQQIASYVKQICEGLQYAHDQGTVHRDVKPENMLVMGMNDIALSDFGIAVTSYDSKNPALTNDGIVHGTFAYIAPERFSGSTRRASDQYSLGIVVYEWLTGTHPYKGAPEQIIYNHINTPPPPLYGVHPHISQEIETIVKKALAKDPDQRYPSVKDFAQALHLAVRTGAQSIVQQPFKQDNVGQPEQQENQKSARKRTYPEDRHIDSMEMTGKADLDEYQGERTEPMEQEVDSGQPQIDSDGQLQQVHTDKLPPVNSGQQAKTSSEPQAYSEQPRQSDAERQPQEQPANKSNHNQASSRPEQPVRSDYQTWQQIMEYNSVKANRPTSNFKLESQDKPSVQLPRRRSKESFTVKLGKWFELDLDFARFSKNKTFRNIGMVLNALSAILLGLLAQPPSGWLIFWGMLYSLVFFNLCIRLVNIILSIGAGLLVALYWGFVGIVIWNGIYLYGPYIPKISPFFIAFLPPSLVALLFFSASAYLHIRYVMSRLP